MAVHNLVGLTIADVLRGDREAVRQEARQAPTTNFDREAIARAAAYGDASLPLLKGNDGPPRLLNDAELQALRERTRWASGIIRARIAQDKAPGSSDR